MARSARRRDADRLRIGLLDEVAQRAAESAAVLADDEDTDVREAVASSLDRLGGAAESLGLDGIAWAASDAAVAVRRREGFRERLDALTRAVEQATGGAVFPAIGVVSASRVERLASEARGLPEPVRVHRSLAALGRDPAAAGLGALIGPAADVASISAPAIRIAVGGPSECALAMASGAVGWLPPSFTIRDAVRVVRRLQARTSRVVACAGVPVDGLPPGAVLVGRASELIAELARAPEVVVAGPLPDLDLDAVCRLASARSVVVTRPEHATAVLMGPPSCADPVTGALSRWAWLDELDLSLARVDRSREPLAVALVRADDLEGVVGRLRAGLRATDRVGRLGADVAGALLPGCTGKSARNRVAAALEGLDARVGVADTEIGRDVAIRADADLQRGRSP